jgi:type I restriction enzyme M protein
VILVADRNPNHRNKAFETCFTVQHHAPQTKQNFPPHPRDSSIAPPRPPSPLSPEPVLTSETKRRLDACRDLLVGKLPLPSDQVELITLALIYKFMDDLDEESVAMGGKRSFFTGPLAKYRWRALLPQTVAADQRVTLFSEGVEAIGNAKTGAHLPELFRDIFRNAFLKFRDGRILTLFLTEVNGFAYSHSEELGNAFEYLLQCMGTQGENGQFRTPRHIIDWIVACLDPQPTDKILDPACGTGGFLVSAYRHILAKNTSPGSALPGDRLGHEQRQRLYANFTGYDITDLMVKLSKVNLFLHQFPSPAIHIYDTLSNDARWSEKADLILANPPFMTPKGGVTPHTKFRVPAKKAEVLFTDYIAEHLTPDGRAGVIVPNGIVATTQNAYVKLRRFLVEDSLVAVVSLPAGVFKPYSGVKTSILLLDKKLARRTDKILFLKIAADGFDLGDQRREITANDLPEAERVMKAWFKGKLADDFASPIKFKAVEKRELLEHRACSLQAEVFFGELAASSDVPTVRLSDVCDVISGQHIDSEDYNYDGRGIGYLTGPSDFGLTYPVITKWSEKPKVTAKGGDVLITVKGSGVGSVNVLQSGEVAISRQLMAIRARGVDARYLHALLRQQKDYFSAQASGAAIPGITRDHVLSFEIPLPPLEEQRRIVAEIEGYQQVIDGARQILTAYQPKLAIDPEWECKPLGDIAEVKLGKMLDKTRHRAGKVLPYLRNINVRWGSVETDDLLEMYFEADELDRFGLRKNDVLVCEGGEPGRAAVWDGRLPDLKFQKALHRVRFNAPYEPKLLVYFLQTLAKTREWEDRFHGATIKHFTREMFVELPVPLPPLTEQQQIVAELDAEAAHIESVRALIPRYEAKIQRLLARVWGTA